MKYYLKRLGHQELGSVKNGKAQRGRYIYISKDKNVLDIFPPLSKTVTNDSSIIPIIPLYQKVAKKIYCNYIYHNDKYNVSGGTRNEYRIYCNGALEGKQLLFQPDDILIFRAEKTSSLPKDILGSTIINHCIFLKMLFLDRILITYIIIKHIYMDYLRLLDH